MASRIEYPGGYEEFSLTWNDKATSPRDRICVVRHCCLCSKALFLRWKRSSFTTEEICCHSCMKGLEKYNK